MSFQYCEKVLSCVKALRVAKEAAKRNLQVLNQQGPFVGCPFVTLHCLCLLLEHLVLGAAF